MYALHGDVNCREYRRGELAGQIARHLIDLHRLASNHYDSLRQYTERLCDRKSMRGNGDVHVHTLNFLDRIHLEHINGARFTSSRHRIGDHEQVARGEEFLREANAGRADLEKLYARPFRAIKPKPSDNLDAEAVVAP